MNKSWQTKKLGEVCDKASSNIAQNKILDNHGEYPLYGAGGFIKNIDFYQQKQDYIAVVKDGAGVGRVVLLKAFSSVLGTMQYLIPKENLDIGFFHYFLTNLDFRKYINGSTIPHIYFKDYSEEPFLLPPLPEQQRIVKILDEVFAAAAKAKENAEKNLANAGELFDSYLQSVLGKPEEGSENKTLEEVCSITSKLIDPREKEFVNLLHVGGANIEIKSGKLIDLKSAKEEKLISGKFAFDPSMVLYSKIRPYLMKVARPDFSGLCSADIYPLYPAPNKLTKDYLYWLLLTHAFTQYAIKGSGRAGMPKVNRDHLFKYEFLLPSLKRQHFIVAKLDALSAETKKLEAIYKQKLSALEELKKSVLQKAFAEEL